MNSLLNSWHPRLVQLACAGAGSDGAHDSNHLHRVWRNACQLLEDYPAADALVVMAACYLHDLVNLPKNHPERHLASRKAALLACRELAALDFPPERLSAVAHAIESHSYSAAIAAETIEAKIVQDADRLDALGAVGLARLFYTAGRMGTGLAHADDPMALHRELDEKAYAIDHIDTKLATIPAKMQTQAGRQLANTRLLALTSFRDDFIAEWASSPATP
ncbi:HD domain-containing protein [Pseudoduganella danionis]|uniref:HD domain-containing protein n=1 Tax=Pseudoduganella danionis TaxID=1890295 RepID=A0ABW9SPM5_9BURK|nr:HD domain-containing protein [Pseudoduganella danionis]MTW32622.1 HD domain-containing protein [Pseudoduganella danionis]